MFILLELTFLCMYGLLIKSSLPFLDLGGLYLDYIQYLF